MGYDVHITRAANWTDSEAHPITLEEWIDYVKSDPEMRLDNAAEVETDEGKLRVESPGLAVWTAWSQHGVDNNMAWMDHRGACIVVKYPDAEVLRKMHAIATRLGAKVQGDDGELYDAHGNRMPSSTRETSAPRASLWQRLTGFAERYLHKPPPLDLPSFNPGDRVHDVFGNPATVIELDPKANAPLGRIRIRYDDGRKATFALAASGLKPIK